MSDPANFPQACNNLGNALATVGAFNEALTAYTAAIIQPTNRMATFPARALNESKKEAAKRL
jgi:hypothetical protein